MIASWYALSTALGMFNKIVVGRDHGLGERGAFPAPLLMSATQFAFQAVLAKLVFASGLMARTAPPLGVREWSRLGARQWVVVLGGPARQGAMGSF
jgi:solute carrier family 35 protein C2